MSRARQNVHPRRTLSPLSTSGLKAPLTPRSLLYHTIKILVYRPLLHDSSPALTSTALAHCRAAAIATSDVLSLWVRTFGHNSYHYLFIYCTFIAA